MANAEHARVYSRPLRHSSVCFVTLSTHVCDIAAGILLKTEYNKFVTEIDSRYLDEKFYACGIASSVLALE